MGGNVKNRLNRLEGLLTRLLIQTKVAQKTADLALSTANQALIEIRALKESTHEVKYLARDDYDAMFKPKEEYGPTVVQEPTTQTFPFYLNEFEQSEEDLNSLLSEET